MMQKKKVFRVNILSLYNQELLQLRIPKEVLDDLKNNSAKDYEI